VGEIDPNDVQLPGVFVNCVYESDPKSKWSEKKIEKFMYRSKPGEKVIDTSPGAKTRAKIAERAAKEVKPGMSINLGIGIPTLIPAFIPPEYGIMLQS
jgi:3-oxoacid CoA-transferase